MTASPSAHGAVTLVVRKTIRASARRLFAAWVEPEHLKNWWGPDQVVCIAAEVDLRVGGEYRVGNQFPDGRVIWIFGEFELIEAPHRLVYTWRAEPGARGVERVTVRFEQRRRETEIIVAHERIPDAATRRQHADGWRGCLDGLERYLAKG